MRQAIAEQGTQLAFVHMGSEAQGKDFFAKYGLADVHQFSDPDAALYRAFGLARAPFWAFLRRDMVRRAREAMRAGHGVGLPVGDGFRMPGVFLMHKGQVVRAYRHESSADRPDYVALARL